MDEQLLKVFSRLKLDPDGQSLIEYLEKLSKDNYELWKDHGGDFLRGKAVAIDNLIKVFATSADKLANQTKDVDWL